MSTPKRHHYLPQFYIEGFCRENSLWIFDRKLNEYRPQTPINTALQSHYYTFKDLEGNLNTDIEKMFSSIEGKTKPIIDKIDEGEKLSEEDKKILSTFIGCIKGRVPDYEKEVNEFNGEFIKKICKWMYCNPKAVEDTFTDIEKDTGKKMDVSPKEMVQFFQDGNYDVITHKNFSLAAMIETSFELASYFNQMDWLLIYAPKKSSFITTDSPFTLIAPDNYDPKSFRGVGIITKGAIKVVPLSQKTCLIMYDKGTRYEQRTASREEIRTINLNVALRCDRFVISRDETLLKNIVKASEVDKTEKKKRVIVN